MGAFTEAVRLPSAKFAAIGSKVEGTVVEIDPTATVPEFDERGRPVGIKYDDNGVALTQVDVTLDTADGRAVLHTDGGVFWSIGRALAEIGAEDLEVGDTIVVEHTGVAEPTAKGRNGAKQYTASVTKG